LQQIKCVLYNSRDLSGFKGLVRPSTTSIPGIATERTSDMKRQPPAASKRRGRPSKFGRPSRVVALTLPEDAIDRLRRVHRDLGWAIVNLLDKEPRTASPRRREAQPDVELVPVAESRSLIVVNREVIGNLPGVNIIPLSGNRAFLALDIDRGLSDLELAVTDRLADPAVGRPERHALVHLRVQLGTWRRDHDLQFHTRAIIVVERRVKKPSDQDTATARAVAAKRKTWAQTATPGIPRVRNSDGPGRAPAQSPSFWS
jgi:hypothetical protein